MSFWAARHREPRRRPGRGAPGTQARLRQLSLAYPGLELAPVLDDRDARPATKAATVARRTRLHPAGERAARRHAGAQLDLAPGSADVGELDLDQLGATAAEQAWSSRASRPTSAHGRSPRTSMTRAAGRRGVHVGAVDRPAAVRDVRCAVGARRDAGQGHLRRGADVDGRLRPDGRRDPRRHAGGASGSWPTATSRRA